MDLNPRIVDVAGREMYTVGGDSSAFTAAYKGYCVSLEWFVGARSTEPMLAIWPAVNERESGVWGICLSSAGKFATPEGTPTPGAFVEAAEVLREVFDRPALKVEVAGLVDVLMRYIPDLILMPPTPRQIVLDSRGKPIWEVTRQENGKTVQEVSI